MKDFDHLVVVVDDDPSILTGLERLLTSSGYRVRLHQDPDSFFEAGPPTVPTCLLLDNQLQAKMSGIEVHAEIVRLGWTLPTVFLTAHWSVQTVVNAIRTGADGFLTKPYDAAGLLKAVAEALQRAVTAHQQHQLLIDARTRVATLTQRERDIVCKILAGKINKEISDELGVALVTVKVHRGRAVAKLGAGNSAELVRIAQLAGLAPDPGTEDDQTAD